MEIAGATILILFVAYGLHSARGVTSNKDKPAHFPSFEPSREEILSLLDEYATTDSVKLSERVKGDEKLLILQENRAASKSNTHGLRAETFDEKSEEVSETDQLEETGYDLGTSSGGSGGSGGIIGGSSSGEISGDNETEVSAAGELDNGVNETEQFRQWLHEELQRMTTVVYDCRDKSETIGDWRNETVGKWLVEQYTQDSMHNESGSAQSINERRERFIFGEDDREFVTDSQDFPQCAIARVSTGCTAFFIGPYHALTAGHCVNNFRSGWRGKIKMWRGRNCHDKGVTSVCSRVFSVVGHTHLNMYDYDYALVEMQGDPAPCWFGIGYINPWDYPSDRELEILGYPYDKRSYNNGQPECSYEAMWRAACNVSYEIRQNLLQWCDAVSGNSGSPVFSETDGNKVVYGLHAQSIGKYVYNEEDERELEYLWNQGPMITPLRYHQILRWMELLEP